jgi:predicted NUDIX family NTP pyrophosphohydrolase
MASGDDSGGSARGRTARRTAKPRPRSIGCLVRASFGGELRFLLVHPSGNYNRRAPDSIPKGLPEEGESEEQTALRETLEETGLACRIVAPLGEIDYRKSRKTIVCFLAEPLEPPASTELEPASWEVDRVEFVTAERARERLHPDQRPFLDRALAFAG